MLSMPRIVRPDPHRFWRARNLGPPLDRPLADPLSETKNWRNLLTGRRGSQVTHSLPAHLERFIGDEAIPDSRLGLNETWTCRIAFNFLAEAVEGIPQCFHRSALNNQPCTSGNSPSLEEKFQLD
jgi:hypothetical protein